MTQLAALGTRRIDAGATRGGDDLQAMDDDEKIDAGIARLATLESGRELAALLRERRDDIVVVDDDDPRLPDGAGGRWDPHAGKLYMERGQLAMTGWESLLAHEAEHMRSMGGITATAWRSLRSVGSGILDALVAPFQLRNPVTAAVDGVRGAFQIDEEAEAYHVQARVARDMGLWAEDLQHPDGTPRSKDEIRAQLLEDPLYAQPPLLRGAVGAGFAWLLGRASAQLANVGIRRVAPESWLAKHPIAITGAGLAIAGALLAQDVLAHRT